MPEKYRSGIYRSEEKIFPLLLRPCKSKGCQKSSLSQEQGSSWCAKVVHLCCWVISQKVAHFLMKKKSAFFSCEHGKLRFPKLTEKNYHFSHFNSKIGPFLAETQQLRWTTPLAHQELPCSCDKLDFWQPLLFHGRNKSGNIFPWIYRCRKNTIFDPTGCNYQVSWHLIKPLRYP